MVLQVNSGKVRVRHHLGAIGNKPIKFFKNAIGSPSFVVPCEGRSTSFQSVEDVIIENFVESIDPGEIRGDPSLFIFVKKNFVEVSTYNLKK